MIRSTGFLVTTAAATLTLAAASLLPLVETQWWAARLLDFPRLYWAGGLAVCLVAAACLLRTWLGRATALLGLAGGALAVNVVILWPYRPSPAPRTEPCSPAQSLSVLIANVQLGNRTSSTLLAEVEAAEPDLFLAMETDSWWDTALAPLQRTMLNTIQELTGSFYGITLYSRLPLVNGEIRYLAGQGTPSVVTGVRLRSGEIVDFIGVHPRPPQVFQSALGRDAELYAAAGVLRAKVEPGILAGDLNATPWEAAVGRMRRLADLTDPRAGFGYVGTWNADTSWVRWPLDQIFHEGGFRTVSVDRLGAFGSDHFPFLARLCRVPETPRTSTPARASDLAAANAVLSAAGAARRLD